jgi:hypothetical protein
VGLSGNGISGCPGLVEWQSAQQTNLTGLRIGAGRVQLIQGLFCQNSQSTGQLGRQVFSLPAAFSEELDTVL